MTVYSDEEAILTGFFSEVLDDVKKSLEIFEEKKVEELKCASCGAPIDLEKCDAKGYYKCEYCSTIEKVAAWHGI
jgi:ribosomal protein L37AE/L43A